MTRSLHSGLAEISLSKNQPASHFFVWPKNLAGRLVNLIGLALCSHRPIEFFWYSVLINTIAPLIIKRILHIQKGGIDIRSMTSWKIIVFSWSSIFTHTTAKDQSGLLCIRLYVRLYVGKKEYTKRVKCVVPKKDLKISCSKICDHTLHQSDSSSCTQRSDQHKNGR